METDPPVPKRKRPVLRIVLLSILIILVIAATLIYQNFNRLISDALIKSFNASVISEVYELKFDNLRVNLIDQSIRVFNVTLVPREKPNEYAYINSSFHLKTDEILLDSVHLRTLLLENKLNVKRILIDKPNVELMLEGERHIMLPFKDTTRVVPDSAKMDVESLFRSFRLKEFQLYEAAFHVTNRTRQREFVINNFSISLKDLLITQEPGEYTTSFKRVVLILGHLSGNMKQGPVQRISFKGLSYTVDSLNLQLSLDTLMYRFRDFSFGFQDLDVQTADSLYHVKLKSFITSYRNKSVRIKDVSFKPNFTLEALQRDKRFQSTGFSGTLGGVEITGLNFDSLLYARKVLVANVNLNQVRAVLFKDKTKPLDPNKYPEYLGQTVRRIPLPISIDQLKVTGINLESNERKPDSTLAKVSIIRGSATVENITNLKPKAVLTLQADAWLMGKAHFNARLNFHYSKPQFDFEGKLDKFNLSGLSPLISAYTPVKINDGVADEISFAGKAEEKSAKGSMKFLYHDLEVDMDLKKAAWANSILAFGANTLLESSNPPKPNAPPRIVNFKIERDRNKGFVNVLIKSLLNGLKETMMMSKENRKKYKKALKKADQEKENKR